jgi:adenylate cyclase
MGLEIERKFLVKNDNWKSVADSGTKVKQGYLNSEMERTVRVRTASEKGILTIKGKNQNLTRAEFEYEIPIDDADALMNLCEKPIIEKTRHLVKMDTNTWEIDVFEGKNKGLVVAEIELQSEDQVVQYPDWLGQEVSTDARYFNSSLIKNPFENWTH